MLSVFLIALFALVLMSVPVAFALLLTALIMMGLMHAFSPTLLIQNMMRGVDNFPLMAIPFFILAGEIMNAGGISKRIVGFAKAAVGHVTGGLGYVTVVASMFFAGVSGSAVADTTAIGSILYPIMEKEGYNKEKSAALFSAAGCIGPIIPPSIPMIIYGVIGNVSIVKLFLSGIIPGVLIGVALMFGWYLYARKRNYKAEGKFSIREVLVAAKNAFFAILLPIIILGGIIFGVYTPTEAGVISVVYAFVVSYFVYRELKLKEIPRLLMRAARSTAVVMLILATATAVAYYITIAQIPQLLSDTILAIAGNSHILIMLVINVLLLLVGCVMDLTPALLIMVPMLLPIAAHFGIDLVYLGCVMVVNLCIGLITPPVGNILYVGCSVSHLPMGKLARAILPNVLIMIAVLMLITYVPGLVTAIPNLVHR